MRYYNINVLHEPFNLCDRPPPRPMSASEWNARCERRRVLYRACLDACRPALRRLRRGFQREHEGTWRAGRGPSYNRHGAPLCRPYTCRMWTWACGFSPSPALQRSVSCEVSVVTDYRDRSYLHCLRQLSENKRVGRARGTVCCIFQKRASTGGA